MIDQFQTIIVLVVGWLLTIAVGTVSLRRYSRRNRLMRRRLRRISSTRDCIVNLLGKATSALKENADIQTFITFYTDYSARSLRAQSAAFFRYDKEQRVVKAAALIGVFPTLFNAPEHARNVLISSPKRLRKYLTSTRFPITDTPFVEAITEQHTVVFDEDDVDERLRIKVCDCWGMMIVPVMAENAVFGVLALANKLDRAAFTEEDVHLAGSMTEMAGITVSHILSFQEIQDKRRMDRQLKDAAVIQAHLLPQLVPRNEHFEIAVHYQPAFRLGGDYYDFINVDENHVGIVIADVSGKGTPAGLVMATTRSLFAAIAQGELSPAAVLRELNGHLLKLIPEEMFVSINYAILDTKSCDALWARAGHEPILFCSAGKAPVSLGEGHGMVVGMVEDDLFARMLKDEAYHLASGDIALFYTDGVTEAHNVDAEEFGARRLANALKTVTRMEADQAVDCIVHRVKRFMREEPAYDDMTLVLIKAR